MIEPYGFCDVMMCR